ncbi:MAG: hypothetical protein QXE50_05795 [Nitrososphaerota archaeon]
MVLEFQRLPGLPRVPIAVVIRIYSDYAGRIDDYIEIIKGLARRHALVVLPGRGWWAQRVPREAKLRGFFMRRPMHRMSLIVMGGSGGVKNFLEDLALVAETARERGDEITFFKRPQIIDHWIKVELEADRPGVLLDATFHIRDSLRGMGLQASERFRPVVLGEPRTAVIRVRIPGGSDVWRDRIMKTIDEAVKKYPPVRVKGVDVIFGPKPEFQLEKVGGEYRYRCPICDVVIVAPTKELLYDKIYIHMRGHK